MSAKVRSVQESRARVEDAFELLTSERWAQLKAEHLRDGSRVVERVDTPDGGRRFVVSRELPGGVPGFLEKFLPKDGRVVQTDVWGPAAADGSRDGTWKVEIPGAPASLGGRLRLEPTADGGRHVIEGEAKVSVPLIGGRAERFIAEMVEKLAAKEGQLLTQTLGA